jgi:putative transposase
MSKGGWHLEEKQVRVSGKPRYLWSAVDQEGEVLDFYLTETRDRDAALTFLRRALKRHRTPEAIPEDTANSGGSAR